MDETNLQAARWYLEHQEKPKGPAVRSQALYAAILNVIRHLEAQKEKRVEELERMLLPPGTALSTTAVPWDAPATESTPRNESTSPPSAQRGMSNGLAEPGCECARPRLKAEWLISSLENRWPTWVVVVCGNCDASRSYAWTPAPAAAETTWISASQASQPSAATPATESTSQSKGAPETLANEELKGMTEEQLRWLDTGSEMALETVKGFIEGRLAIRRHELDIKE